MILYIFWKSKSISLDTKLHIFKTDVPSVLVYALETCRVIKRNTGKYLLTNACEEYLASISLKGFQTKNWDRGLSLSQQMKLLKKEMDMDWPQAN